MFTEGRGCAANAFFGKKNSGYLVKHYWSDYDIRDAGQGESEHMSKLFWASAVMLAVVSTAVHAQTAKFLEKKGDWSVYAHDAGGKKVCFVVAQPRTSKPTNVKRDPIYFYLSNWPKDKVSNEISVKMGYPLKPGVPAEIKIGDKAFQLFTKDEGAYVEKASVEAEVVGAMKAGTTMVVQGRSTRGTLTTDEYSLSGVTGAIGAAEKACK